MTIKIIIQLSLVQIHIYSIIIIIVLEKCIYTCYLFKFIMKKSCSRNVKKLFHIQRLTHTSLHPASHVQRNYISHVLLSVRSPSQHAIKSVIQIYILIIVCTPISSRVCSSFFLSAFSCAALYLTLSNRYSKISSFFHVASLFFTFINKEIYKDDIRKVIVSQYVSKLQFYISVLR